MPRPRTVNPGLHVNVQALVDSLSTLVEAVRGTVHATAAKVATATAAPRKKGQRGPGRGNPKLKSALKRSWANYTPAQRKARIAKMLEGRGLRPKRG